MEEEWSAIPREHQDAWCHSRCSFDGDRRVTEVISSSNCHTRYIGALLTLDASNMIAHRIVTARLSPSATESHRQLH